MSTMFWLRLAGGFALAFLIWAAFDRFEQKREVARYGRCTAAIAKPATPGLIESCDAAVAREIDAARKARACEAALKGNDLYAIRASCGAEAKRVHAERDAARSNETDLKSQLADADRRIEQAIGRAEARGAARATREQDNARAIESAPRGADGRVRCDAECLRRIAGDAAPAGR